MSTERQQAASISSARLLDAAPEMLAACVAWRTAAFELSNDAGDVPEWNKGGCAYEAARKVDAALAKVLHRSDEHIRG